MYAIKRSDGKWYIGTVDHKPLFGEDSHMAKFKTRPEASTRLVGIETAEQNNRTFGIIPVKS